MSTSPTSDPIFSSATSSTFPSNTSMVQVHSSVPSSLNIVIALGLLVGLLVVLAFNAAVWYWVIKRRPPRKADLQSPGQLESGSSRVPTIRTETTVWSDITLTPDSRVLLSNSKGASKVEKGAESPFEELSRWRWPATTPAPPPKLIVDVSVSPAARAGTPSPSMSRSQSPSSSRALTPPSMDELTAAYSMPYGQGFHGDPLPSPPPFRGLSPMPPRPASLLAKPRATGRRSPLGTSNPSPTTMS